MRLNGSAHLRRGLALIAVAALLGTVVGVATAAPLQSPPDDPVIDVAQITGVGERLVLVVGGEFATEEDALEAAAGLGFGEMAGFYVDATDNYEVIGFYDQTSPDALDVACEDLPKTVGECEPGSHIVAHQAVSLKYHDLVEASAFLGAPPDARCDDLGHRPCVAKRLLALLTQPDRQFQPGKYLLVSAFRTRRGAEEFSELARDRGATAAVVRGLKLAGPYVGLGQEANPDGVSGPVLSPLKDPESYQR